MLNIVIKTDGSTFKKKETKNYVRVLLEAKKFRCALLTSTNKMQTANMFLHKKAALYETHCYFEFDCKSHIEHL